MKTIGILTAGLCLSGFIFLSACKEIPYPEDEKITLVKTEVGTRVYKVCREGRAVYFMYNGGLFVVPDAKECQIP